MNVARTKITGIGGKKEKLKGPKCWIAERKVLELWNLNIRCGKYCNYLSIWSKVSLGYALEVWNERTKKFLSFDWILYNNKVLKKNAEQRENLLIVFKKRELRKVRWARFASSNCTK
jgi:hypothetical protein